MTKFIGILGLAAGLSIGFYLLLRLYSKILPTPPFVDRVFIHHFTVIAHRGGAGEGPENTWATMEQSLALHPQMALEFDLRLTKDRQLIVFHDPTLDRTTNQAGRVSDKTLAELNDVNFAAHFEGAGSIGVTTFETVLSQTTGRVLIVEIKDDAPEVEKLAWNIVQKFNAEDRVVFGSFHSHVLEKLRRLSPRVHVSASQNELMKLKLFLSVGLGPLAPLKGDVLLIPETYQGTRVLDQELISEVHRRGKKVFVWTVNKKEDVLRLKNMGVDGVITDFPTQVVDLLK